MIAASIGISAHMGWVSTAVVALDASALRVLRTDRIDTAPAGDREALEPYHVAGGFDGLNRVPAPADPQAVVERGLARQRTQTLENLQCLIDSLGEAGVQIESGGMLTGRGKPAPTLAKAIGSHTQIHVAEGLAVRHSVTTSLEQLGVVVEAIDQKTLFDAAQERLGFGEKEIMTILAALRPEVAGAWRKEDKLAAIAAWIAMV